MAMRPILTAISLATIAAGLLSCAQAAPRKDDAPMKTRIELDPAMPLLLPAKPPRVAMGEDIRLLAGIGNKGAQDLAIEDPKSTQLILVHVKTPQDTVETSFLLNPSLVDATGEMTAPPRSELAVKPGTYAPFRLSLYKFALDKCLSEGQYEVAFSYGDTRSPSATLAVEFAPASVAPLLALLEDAGKDMWVRKEALKWLRKLKADFTFDFAKPDAREFRAWWDVESKKPDPEARFRALR
jgi:hypothetical protein